LAGRLSRRRLIAVVTLFFCGNMLIFWFLRPNFLFKHLPYAGIAFYLWVGIFSVTVVAQFWAFAADLYTDERGKRLFPLIAIGASAGASCGSWLTERLLKLGFAEPSDLILAAILPLMAALTVLLGVQVFLLSLHGFIVFNVILVFCWAVAAAVLVQEHRRLARGDAVFRSGSASPKQPGRTL